MGGIVAVYNLNNAAKEVYTGLVALQHRGTHSAGMVSFCNGMQGPVKEEGLASIIFSDKKLRQLKGNTALGVNRLPDKKSGLQPICANFKRGIMAVAHNGNIENYNVLKKELEGQGQIFQSSLDSELFIHSIACSQEKTIEDAIIKTFIEIKGSYSLVFAKEDSIIAVRDIYGFKPLVLGKIKKGYIVASETFALKQMNAEYMRDVEPGEILTINKEGLHSRNLEGKLAGEKQRFCIMELTYLMNPVSYFSGEQINSIRIEIGREMYRQNRIKADMIVPVPYSGTVFAEGFSRESGMPLSLSIIKNHFAETLLMDPEEKTKQKYLIANEEVAGKRIVVIDDSLNQGHTSKHLIKRLTEAGAKEIHWMLATPITSHSCNCGNPYLIEEKLVGARQNGDSKGIMKEIGNGRLKSLTYMKLENLLKVLPNQGYCTHCFTGEKPY